MNMTIKGAILGLQGLHTYNEDASMPTGARDCLACREMCTADTSLRLHVAFRRWRIIHRENPPGHGAPPDDFRVFPEYNFRFTVAHADGGLFAAHNEGYLRRPAENPLRLTEGHLRTMEDLR